MGTVRAGRGAHTAAGRRERTGGLLGASAQRVITDQRGGRGRETDSKLSQSGDWWEELTGTGLAVAHAGGQGQTTRRVALNAFKHLPLSAVLSQERVQFKTSRRVSPSSSSYHHPSPLPLLPLPYLFVSPSPRGTSLMAFVFKRGEQASAATETRLNVTDMSCPRRVSPSQRVQTRPTLPILIQHHL